MSYSRTRHDPRQMNLFEPFSGDSSFGNRFSQNRSPNGLVCASMPHLIPQMEPAAGMLTETKPRRMPPDSMTEGQSEASHAIQDDRARTDRESPATVRRVQVQQFLDFDREPLRGDAVGESPGPDRATLAITAGCSPEAAFVRIEGQFGLRL